MEWVSILGVSNECVASLCLLEFLDGQSTHQNEYVFCLPPRSFLLPIFHLFHCLPYSSLITELPEYQITANSSASINKFLCLQWNYANFHQLKMLFSFFITIYFTTLFHISNNFSTIFFFIMEENTSTLRASFPCGSFAVVTRQQWRLWLCHAVIHASLRRIHWIGVFCRKGGSICFFFSGVLFLFW